MTRSRFILLGYCILLAATVLIVPWTYTRGEIRYDREFAFLFTDMGRKTIDYGMIVLEVIALSSLTGIAYLLSAYFDDFRDALSRALEPPKSTSRFKEYDAEAAAERAAAKAHWEGFWDEELVFLGWHLTRYRIVIWFVVICLLAYYISLLSK